MTPPPMPFPQPSGFECVLHRKLSTDVEDLKLRDMLHTRDEGILLAGLRTLTEESRNTRIFLGGEISAIMQRLDELMIKLDGGMDKKKNGKIV